jgi:4-hydroxybenzoate polyprenyltransferase
LTGIGLCALASPASRDVALALAAAILIYDGGAKQTALGPVSMGACRFANVALGLSVSSDWTAWMWIAAITMGLYTAVITYLARDEVGGSSRVRLQIGVLLMAVLGIGFALAFTVAAPAARLPDVWWALPFLGYVLLRGVSLFRPLLADESGPTIGRAIGGGILLMPAIDATVVAGAGCPAGALLVVAFSIPALWLKRAFYVT